MAGYFAKFKRKAHAVTVEGIDCYVRSLLRSEVNHVQELGKAEEAAAKDKKTDDDAPTTATSSRFVMLKYGLCDEHGATVVKDSDAETFDEEMPIAAQHALIAEIRKVTNPSTAKND